MGGAFQTCCCTPPEPDFVQAIALHLHSGFAEPVGDSGDAASLSDLIEIATENMFQGMVWETPGGGDLQYRRRHYLSYKIRYEGHSANSPYNVVWQEFEYRYDRHTNDVIYDRYENSYGAVGILDQTPDAPTTSTTVPGDPDIPMEFGPPGTVWNTFPYSYSGDEGDFWAHGTWDDGGESDPIDVFLHIRVTFGDLYTDEDVKGDALELLDKFNLPSSFDGTPLTGRYTTSDGQYAARYRLEYSATPAPLGMLNLVVDVDQTNGPYAGPVFLLSSPPEIFNPINGGILYVTGCVAGLAYSNSSNDPYAYAAKAYIFPNSGGICEVIKTLTPTFETAGDINTKYTGDLSTTPFGQYDGHWLHTDDDTARLAYFHEKTYSSWPAGCGPQ